MGLILFIIIIYMTSTQISFTSSNCHSKIINGMPRKPINGHDGVPMLPPRRAIQEITYIAPPTGEGLANWNAKCTDGPDYSDKNYTVKRTVILITNSPDYFEKEFAVEDSCCNIVCAGPMQTTLDFSVLAGTDGKVTIISMPPPSGVRCRSGHITPSGPITSSPIQREHVPDPVRVVSGGGPANWNPNPTDGPDYSEKQFAVKKTVIIIVVVVAVIAVVIAVLLAIILSCKLMNKEEGSAPSLASTRAAEQYHSTLSRLNVQRASIIPDAALSSKNQQFLEPSSELVHSGSSSNKQMVSVDAALSSNQQQLFVPPKSSPNISINDIVNIKKYCSESSPIAKGSFGSVYKMTLGDEILAIKEIKDENAKNWVEDEGNLMMGKEHININKLYGWWIGDKSYLAYMYIHGCSLKDYLRGNCAGFAYSW